MLWLRAVASFCSGVINFRLETVIITSFVLVACVVYVCCPYFPVKGTKATPPRFSRVSCASFLVMRYKV